MDDVKQWLNRARYIRRHIAYLQERRARLQSRLDAPRATQLSFLPAAHNDKAFEDSMVELVELCHEIDAEIARAYRVEKQILQAIESLDNEIQRDVITMRYIDGKSWTWIETKIPYSRRALFMQHKKALAKVRRMMNAVFEKDGDNIRDDGITE